MSILPPELDFNGAVGAADGALRTLQPFGAVKDWAKWVGENPGKAALVGTLPFWGPAVAASLGVNGAALESAAQAVGSAVGL